jgi:hypothetical protein
MGVTGGFLLGRGLTSHFELFAQAMFLAAITTPYYEETGVAGSLSAGGRFLFGSHFYLSTAVTGSLARVDCTCDLVHNFRALGGSVGLGAERSLRDPNSIGVELLLQHLRSPSSEDGLSTLQITASSRY